MLLGVRKQIVSGVIWSRIIFYNDLQEKSFCFRAHKAAHFRCSYYSEAADDFSHIMQHIIINCGAEKMKICYAFFDDQTGKQLYISKDY